MPCRGSLTSALAALVWMVLAALAGMTPTRWHRPAAYGLMLAFVPVVRGLALTFGPWPASGFFAVALFQLRLLLLSWGRKLYRWIRK